MKNNILQKSIPNGWQEVKVGEVFDFLGTYAISRDNLANGILNGEAIGNIHYGDIHARYMASSIDLDKIAIPQARDKKFSPEKKDFLVDGDLVMADVSEDYEGIGKAISVHGIGDKKVVGGLHTFVLRDRKGKTDEHYRQYIFKNQDIRSVLKKIANGISVYGVSKSGLSKITLNLPSIKEQKRIVAVLETWDQVIEKLAEKIEVKKNIKKALLQQLLSEKKRFQGFSDNWKRVNLGNLLNERKERDVESKNLPLFSLTIENGVCPKSDRYDRSFLVKSDGKVYKKTCKNDIVYNPANLRFGAIAQNKNDKPVLLSPIYQVLYLKNEKENNVDFIGHLLTWDRQVRKMSAYAEGTLIERMEVKIGSFKTISIEIPSFEEQVAIANILTTADKDIVLLEKKLASIKEQKKFLLNNLITGQIRVPACVTAGMSDKKTSGKKANDRQKQ